MPTHRAYDHRIKRLIADAGDPNLFPSLKIPPSTAREWIKKGSFDVVTLPELDRSSEDLVIKINQLKNELESFKTKQKLVIFTFRIFGLQIQYKRLPRDEEKKLLIEAIKSAANSLDLNACLDAIGLSLARYHHWLRSLRKCKIPEADLCPRAHPLGLTAKELAKIKEYISSKRFAHFSISSLAIFAKRKGDLFASPATWSRVVRKLGLRRPSKRVYPPKPKVGIRATSPNQLWHIDLSVIKLQDGTRCYIQAIIDNFSRYVLASNVTSDYGGVRTAELIRQAIEKTRSITLKPTLMCDQGTENLNSEVDSLLEEQDIKRVVAQIDIDFSNSMVEALFKRMKHNYLFNHPLTSLQALREKLDYYIEESNNQIPLASLKGATPSETFFSRLPDDHAEKIKIDHKLAIRARIESNRNTNCGICVTA
ncbi:MAG: DDE-type integrase/transposase/recombinase [Pseudobacteriovorax sp.]|nr:DDE-type integrase/transposase/recombinase [Pseudobacteriovorax sp.]